MRDNDYGAEVERWYEAYSAALFHYLLKRTGDIHEAEELMQDTFIRILERRERPEYIKPWLFRTAHHLFIDRWRRKRKIAFSPLEDTPEPGAADPLADPETAVLDKEADELFAEAVRILRPSIRKIVWMKEWEGRTYKEIANETKQPEGTVKSMVHRARNVMRKRMETPRSVVL